jgi:hypothetical protein
LRRTTAALICRPGSWCELTPYLTKAGHTRKCSPHEVQENSNGDAKHRHYPSANLTISEIARSRPLGTSEYGRLSEATGLSADAHRLLLWVIRASMIAAAAKRATAGVNKDTLASVWKRNPSRCPTASNAMFLPSIAVPLESE